MLLERMESDRIITFRVAWIDDKGATQVNRGYRIQMNSAMDHIGRTSFSPFCKFKYFKIFSIRANFKISLTTLPMGGGKGGADFDPKVNQIMK
jgi:glutamate dehydrogenase (NADP+)